jgi:3-hydroxybutyryl-CoA dehydratase
MKEHALSDLTIGLTDRLEVQVTQADVDRFVEFSGDLSAVHVNDDYARAKGFPGRIAHGMLLGAYVSALIGNQLPGKHGVLQSCELEFRAPLIPPERVEVVGEVTAVSAGTGQVTLKVTVKNSAGKILLTGKVKSVVRQPADENSAISIA